jgi:SAM-dependent methyltransferase
MFFPQKKVISSIFPFKIKNALNKIFPHSERFKSKVFRSNKSLFEGSAAIEIGGPSPIFQNTGLFPLYAVAESIDNCNFGGSTIWEGNINVGKTFIFNKNKSPGNQFVLEATNLDYIDSNSYDLLLSSHMIEHTANPILAFSEWIRVVKNRGLLVVIFPHKDGTFDHKRPTTTIDHLISDFDCNTQEDDMTHLSEILNLHDLKRDPGAGSHSEFSLRSKNNVENRCLHHHVFDTNSSVRLINHLGLHIRAVEVLSPMSILIVAEKFTEEKPNNEVYMNMSEILYKKSPFASDHV